MKHFVRYATGIAAVALLTLAGCQSGTDAEFTASPTTVTQLRTEPGFSWLDGEMTTYKPDAAKVQAIATAFSQKHQQITIFVNPSCSCNGTKKTFPQTLRVLRDAGVPDSLITIYPMPYSTSNHPEKAKYSVRGLPSIYINNNGQTVYIVQALKEVLYANPIGQQDAPAGTRLVEDILAEGFAF